MERLEQIIHMLEQINKQESQFKHIRVDHKQWHGVHVSYTSGVKGDQLFEHPECKYLNFYYLMIWILPYKLVQRGWMVIVWVFALVRLLDYECSILVPLYMHWHNAAKKAIQTFENHFIAIMAGVNKYFPILHWDKLLLQTELTLNMVWATKIKPWVSANTYFLGQHNYNKMLLVPIGCFTITHNNP